MSSRVNEVNGENLQDPPNQKSWLRQWSVYQRRQFSARWKSTIRKWVAVSTGCRSWPGVALLARLLQPFRFQCTPSGSDILAMPDGLSYPATAWSLSIEPLSFASRLSLPWARLIFPSLAELTYLDIVLPVPAGASGTLATRVLHLVRFLATDFASFHFSPVCFRSSFISRTNESKTSPSASFIHRSWKVTWQLGVLQNLLITSSNVCRVTRA